MFNPGRGRGSRFAPLRRRDGSFVPTLYAATSFECATHETLFHDIAHDAPDKSIDLGEFAALDHSTLRLTTDLKLTPLFAVDLGRWRLSRKQLIDTDASEYGVTRMWALAIYESYPDVAGLVWTSKRCDPEKCFLLFGDRFPPGGFQVISRHRIETHPGKMKEIEEFAERADIMIAR